MTTTYESGSAVRSGYYLDASRWHIEPIANDGDRLPAGRGSWRRIPAAVALVLVPALGGLFLVFLPFAGIYLTLRALVNPLVVAFQGGATELAATVTPGWQPGEAHFTGKRQEAREDGTAGSDGLEALAREIERRRSER